MGVSIGLGGVLGYSITIFGRVRDSTMIYTGLGRGRGGLVGAPLGCEGVGIVQDDCCGGLGRYWDLYRDGKGVGWLGGHSPWAESGF